MIDSNQVLTLANCLTESGYNVTIGPSNGAQFIVTSGECPNNYKTTEKLKLLLPSFLSREKRDKISLDIVSVAVVVIAFALFLNYQRISIYKASTFSVTMGLNLMPSKPFASGIYNSTSDFISSTFFSKVRIYYSRFLYVFLSWSEDQTTPTSDVFSGLPLSTFRSDETSSDKTFTSITKIVDEKPTLSFNIDDMTISSVPIEFPLIDLLPINETFRLSFQTMQLFNHLHSFDDLKLLAENIRNAFDLCGVAIAAIESKKVFVMQVTSIDESIAKLLTEFFQRFDSVDPYDIPVIADTIGLYRLWGSAITVGSSIYVISFIRHNKSWVIRGPEFVVSQMAAMKVGAFVSLMKQNKMARIEAAYKLKTESSNLDVFSFSKQLIKEGSLLIFTEETTFNEPHLKFDASILPILQKKKNCIIRFGNGRKSLLVSFLPQYEFRGFLSFLPDKTFENPIIYLENAPFMGWLVRVDTLEVVWYISSCARTIDDVIQSVSDDDKGPFRAAVEHTRQYRQVDMCIKAHIKIGSVFKICRVLLFRTSDDYFVITASDEEEYNKSIAELKEMEHTVTLALTSGNVTLWNYEDTSNPPRIFLSWSDTRPSCFANRTSIESNVLIDYQQTVFDLFNKCMQKGMPFIVDVPVLIGTIKWCSIRGIRTSPNSLQLLNIDITQTKEAEERLIVEKKRVEEAANAKTRFLANMSHEIRNPLNGISGLIELLCDTNLPKTNEESLDVLTTSFGKLLDLLNDTLDLAKIEQGKMTPSWTIFNPIVELNSTVRKFKKTPVPVITKTDPNLPIKLYGDPHFFGRIISNLFSNALKFTHEGMVRVIMSSDEESFQLVVEDSGIGMSEEDQQQFFGIFTMGDSSITRPYGGIGVGLALCQKMLNLLGGRMELKSTIGKGSTFTVHFPFPAVYVPFVPSTIKEKHYQILDLSRHPSSTSIITPHCEFYGIHLINDPKEANEKLRMIFIRPCEEDLQIARDINKRIPEAKILTFCNKDTAFHGEDVKLIYRPIPLPVLLSLFSEVVWRKTQITNDVKLIPIRVLLAEDNSTNQLVMRKMFQKLGIDATIVGDGREAINALKLSEYDVLFLDEYMPILDGPSAAREIRASSEKYKDVTIVALTASHGKDDEIECLNAGMNAFLTKPVTIRMMRDILHKCATGKISIHVKNPV